MSNEEEFDKIIRDKVGQAEYSFDENHWAKASQLIDADRTASNKGIWKKILLPGVIVVGSIAAYFMVQEHDTSKLVSAQQSAAAVSSRTEGLPAQLAANEINAGSETAQPVVINADVFEPAVPAANSDRPLNKPESGQAGVISTDSKSDRSEKPLPPEIKNETDIPLASIAESKKSAKEGVVSESATRKADAPDVNKPEGISEAGGLPLATSAGVAGMNEGTASKQASESTPAPAMENESSELIEADLLTAHQSVLPFSANVGSATMPFVYLKRYDEDYFSKKAKTHFLNAEFGSTYLFGWNTEQGKDGQGLNWFAGLNYGYYVGKFSLGIGLQAYNITNMREAFYAVENTEYSFGSSTSYTSVTTNDMFFMSVPLRVSYHLNRSNHVGIGFNTGYLVSMHNRLEGYQVGENGTSVRPSEKNKTMYEGVKSFNYMGSFFYNARLNNRVAVHAEFVYSFADLFENTESVRNAEKPVGLRLGVQYYLFDK